MDDSILNDDQRSLLRRARFLDMGAVLADDEDPKYQSTLLEKIEKENRAEAHMAARRAAVAGPGVLNDRQKMLLGHYGMETPANIASPTAPVTIPGLGAPDLATMGAAADAAAPVAPSSLLDAGGGLTPLNPAQQMLAGGVPSAAKLRWLAANGVDVSGIAPKLEGQDIYTPDGRKQRAYVNPQAPGEVIPVGGAAAADPTKLEFREVGKGGGRVVVGIDPATGREVTTVGDPMYPQPDKPAQPTVASVIAPIVQKMAAGEALTQAESKALEYYKAVDPMNQWIGRLLNGGGGEGGEPPPMPQPAGNVAPTLLKPPPGSSQLPQGVPQGSVEMPPRKPGTRLFKTPDGKFLEGN